MPKYPLHLTLLISFILILSCRSSFDPEIRTGATEVAVEGYPEFSISTFGYFDENNEPVLDALANVVLGSLVYTSENGQFKASISARFTIYEVDRDNENSRDLIKTEESSYQISDQDSEITMSTATLELSKKFSVPAGDYLINTTIQDNTSGKSIYTETTAVVLGAGTRSNEITHVIMDGITENNESQRMLGYTIPGEKDSLKFNYQLYSDGSSVKIESRLVQFASDTTIPRSMSAPNYSMGSIQYRGINYNERTIIQQQTREIEQEGIISFSFTTPRLERGNYRYEIELYEKENGDWKSLDRKGRDFAFLSENFPRITTIKEMSKPMTYLMSNREYDRFIAIQDKDSLKNAFEKFWLENLNNPSQAQAVIAKYFDRVESANKNFSNFKEGWMTDMGMVYILFGEPWYVERYTNMVYWIYTYDSSDQRKIFAFRRTRTDSDSHPFEHYILQRRQLYHTEEFRQIEEWVGGYILQRI